MEKKKFEIKAAAPTINTCKGISVASFIPYAEKENFVMELLAATMQLDEELGICYRGYNQQAVFAYLFLKYYTDVDVEGVEIGQAFDWVTSLMDLNDLYDFAYGDITIVRRMADDFYASCEKRFEQEHCLGQLAKQYLNTDVNTENAETRELIERLIDMKGALLEKQNDEKILQFGAKKTAKSVKTGGVKINISKKG